MTQLSDEDLLMALAATGAAEPLDELLVRYWGECYRIFLRCLNDPEAARELVHEQFSRLALAVPALTDEQTFRGWLHSSVLKRLRLRESQGEGVPTASAPPSHPDEALSLDELRRLVSELPLDERMALVLHHFEGLDPAEVAAGIEATVSVARTRIADGLQQLHTRASELDVQTPDEAGLVALMTEAPSPVAPTPPAAETLVADEDAGPARARALLVAGVLFAALLIGGALSVLTGEVEDDWAPSSPTAPAVVLAPTRTPSATPSPGASATAAPSPDPSATASVAPSPGGGVGVSQIETWLRHPDGQAAADYVLFARAVDRPAPGFVRLRADAAGLIATAQAPPGTYELRLYDTPRAEVIAQVTIGPGANRVELTVPRRRLLRGVVVDPRGVPVGGAAVWLYDAAEARTGPDGRFELGEQPLGSLPLSVRAEGFRQLERSWVEHTGEELQVTLDEGRELVVRGRLGPTAPETGFVGYATTVAGKRHAGTAPVAEGAFEIRLTDLPPALDVTLAIRAGDASGPAQLVVNTDQQEADVGVVDVPRGRVLRGQVRTPDSSPIPAGQGMVRVYDGLFDPGAVVAPDGSFEVRGLGTQPAELELTVVGDDVWGAYLHARRPLDPATIEGGDVGLVELRSREPDALRVAPVAVPTLRRLGLEPQDMLVEVEGIATAQGMVQALALAAQAGRPVTVQVARPGRQARSVELDLSGWDEARLRQSFSPAIRR